MSKPNLLGFSTSVGFYRNKRVRDLRLLLLKSITDKVSKAELAPMFFQAVMAYAGENQIDGNFSGYTIDDWCEIFASNHLRVEPRQASAIIKGFEQVGLFDHGKIRSWAKYNRHFAEHEQIVKWRKKGAKIMHKKREQEARDSLKNRDKSPSEPAPKPEQNGHSKKEISRDVMMLERAIAEIPEGHPQRRDLVIERKKLLGQYTGKDLKKPAPAPTPAPGKPRKPKPGDALMMARQALADAPELLSDNAARVLIEAGELPKGLEGRFRKLIEEHEKKVGHNPVPE